MRKFRLIILLTLFFIPVFVKAADYRVPKVDTSQRVYDYANLLTEEQKQDLYNQSMEYLETYKYELIFVTIDQNPYGTSPTDDRYMELYAEDFVEYNEIKNSVILLIDMDNRGYTVSAYWDTILIFDDARKSQIISNAKPYLVSGDYYGAFNQMSSDVTKYTQAGIPSSNKDYCIDKDTGRYYNCAPRRVNWLVATLVGVGLTLIIFFIHLRKYKGIRLATNANAYLKQCTHGARVDQFLTTFTSKVRRSHDSGGSGGGGGSSISLGSGGGFHSSSSGRF